MAWLLAPGGNEPRSRQLSTGWRLRLQGNVRTDAQRVVRPACPTPSSGSPPPPRSSRPRRCSSRPAPPQAGLRRDRRVRPLRPLVPRGPGQPGVGLPRRRRPGHERPAGHERHPDRPPLPPGRRRAGVHGASRTSTPAASSSAPAPARRSTRCRSALDWPSPGEQIERLDQGLEAITRLWAGETVTMDAGWFRLKEAKLYTRAEGRPRLYVVGVRPAGGRGRRAATATGCGRSATPSRRPRSSRRTRRPAPARAGSPARSSSRPASTSPRTRPTPSRRAQVEGDAAAARSTATTSTTRPRWSAGARAR